MSQYNRVISLFSCLRSFGRNFAHIYIYIYIYIYIFIHAAFSDPLHYVFVFRNICVAVSCTQRNVKALFFNSRFRAS